MASHRRLVKHFGRKATARVALMRGLMKSLIEHGRIKTTLAKAKETRRYIEKAITLGKKNTLNSKRVLTSRLADSGSAIKLVDEVSSRFLNRNGGYTRIIKLGVRPGDKAEMAFIEFVDYDWKEPKGAKLVVEKEKNVKVKSSSKVADKKSEKKAEKSAIKIESKLKKEKFELKDKAKKHLRKIKNQSRAAFY